MKSPRPAEPGVVISSMGCTAKASKRTIHGRKIMSERAAALAAKLSSEGERTFAFFQSLPESAWTKPCYSEGAAWTVRGALEHLIVSERALLALYRAMVDNAGTGAEPDFDIQAFNELNRN